MSMSVSNRSLYLYNSYILNNSAKYAQNKIDFSAVSKEKYNVSNLSNALNALGKASSVNFYSLDKVQSFVQDVYTLSQTDSHKTLNDSPAASVVRLLSGAASSDDIYALIQYSHSLSDDAVKNWADTYTSMGSKYNHYLTQSGSIIDLLG